ncbi:hypothetical protein BS47DRAFT_1358116 [Hydnum rufescens UP504]|uniref:Uncharacterized protein n=1 Tax=Hydnum rufescens UP504 TaxID=1448309 RepID=A0A9P6BAZ9_9AGAM|nr:hypothetical protein BS47DRAFT_1358116 [Hydnum rufescens UP504]
MDSGDCRQNCSVTLPNALREGDEMMYGQSHGVTLPNALGEGDEMMYGWDKKELIHTRGGMDSGDCRQNRGVTLPGALREGDKVTCEQDNAQKKELAGGEVVKVGKERPLKERGYGKKGWKETGHEFKKG